MTDWGPVLGGLAGVVSVADVVPYLRDTARRSTRPHRGTCLIWSVLGVVVCFSQLADGASWSLILAANEALLTTLVFLLALRLGIGGLSPVDLLLLAIAGAGVVGWFTADAPVVATTCVVVADLIRVAMTVRRRGATAAPRRCRRSRWRAPPAPWRPPRSARWTRHCSSTPCTTAPPTARSRS